MEPRAQQRARSQGFGRREMIRGSAGLAGAAWAAPTVVRTAVAGAVGSPPPTPPPPTPTVVYFEDFEDPHGPEWSSAARTQDGQGRTFLGPFTTSEITLSLTGLPTHSKLRIEFDLFVLDSWDGNGHNFGGGTFLADVWRFTGPDGSVFDTTFSCTSPAFHNINVRQAYPQAYPGGDNPPGTGAAESANFYGNPSFEDSRYELLFEKPHAGTGAIFKFAGFGLDDESWGLDNVKVTAI